MVDHKRTGTDESIIDLHRGNARRYPCVLPEREYDEPASRTLGLRNVIASFLKRSFYHIDVQSNLKFSCRGAVVESDSLVEPASKRRRLSKAISSEPQTSEPEEASNNNVDLMEDAEVVVRVDVDSDNEEEDNDDFIPAFQLAQELDFATMESNLKAELKAFIYIDVESLMGKLGK